MTPPFCHSANTPKVSGAAAMSDGVNGKLWNLMDIRFDPPRLRTKCYARLLAALPQA
jgi:hypothetical protein